VNERALVDGAEELAHAFAETREPVPYDEGTKALLLAARDADDAAAALRPGYRFDPTYLGPFYRTALWRVPFNGRDYGEAKLRGAFTELNHYAFVVAYNRLRDAVEAYDAADRVWREHARQQLAMSPDEERAFLLAAYPLWVPGETQKAPTEAGAVKAREIG
jgi:hypothetical protein